MRNSMGLTIHELMPAAMQRSSSSRMALAVTPMIGMTAPWRARAGQFVAVELGHVHVGEQGVILRQGPERQGIRAIGCDGDGAAQLFQLVAQGGLVDRIVLGHQHAQAQSLELRFRRLGGWRGPIAA